MKVNCLFKILSDFLTFFSRLFLYVQPSESTHPAGTQKVLKLKNAASSHEYSLVLLVLESEYLNMTVEYSPYNIECESECFYYVLY
jgi:hypothetical protein